MVGEIVGHGIDYTNLNATNVRGEIHFSLEAFPLDSAGQQFVRLDSVFVEFFIFRYVVGAQLNSRRKSYYFMGCKPLICLGGHRNTLWLSLGFDQIVKADCKFESIAENEGK